MTPHDVRPDDPLVRWMVAPVSADATGDLASPRPSVSEGRNVAWLGRRRAEEPYAPWLLEPRSGSMVIAATAMGFPLFEGL